MSENRNKMSLKGLISKLEKARFCMRNPLKKTRPTRASRKVPLQRNTNYRIGCQSPEEKRENLTVTRVAFDINPALS